MTAAQLRRLNAGIAAAVRAAQAAGDTRNEDLIINSELVRSGLAATSITKPLGRFMRHTFGGGAAARRIDRKASLKRADFT